MIGDGDGGAGCTNLNPQLQCGYFLSPGSYAIGHGSQSATNAGLVGMVTTTNGAGGPVPGGHGYHYPAGSRSVEVHKYVRMDGTNSNSGQRRHRGRGWKTVSYAMSQAQPGWIVHVATGNYTRASGETFANAYDIKDGGILVPEGVRLRGADPAKTVLDAGRVVYGRVLYARWPSAAVDGFTLRSGYAWGRAAPCTARGHDQ